jgi:hypothetical protein
MRDWGGEARPGFRYAPSGLRLLSELVLAAHRPAGRHQMGQYHTHISNETRPGVHQDRDSTCRDQIASRDRETIGSLPDSIRMLVPRIALAMVYDVRSKRGAVHVKEIDPRRIDVDLAARAASWIMAELIRLYHVDDESAVQLEMTALTRATFPLLESIDGEDFVSKKVPPRVEIQLLLGRKGGEGATRTQLGKMAKCDAPRVTEAIKGLVKDRQIHLTKKGIYYLTGSGEADLMKWLAENRPI